MEPKKVIIARYKFKHKETIQEINYDRNSGFIFPGIDGRWRDYFPEQCGKLGIVTDVVIHTSHYITDWRHS